MEEAQTAAACLNNQNEIGDRFQVPKTLGNLGRLARWPSKVRSNKNSNNISNLSSNYPNRRNTG